MLYMLLFAGVILSGFTSVAIYSGENKFVKWFPNICENNVCKAIIFADNARLLFNIPNSVFGVLYYLLLFAGAMVGIFTELFWLTVPAAVMSVYLSYRIFFVHQVLCKICVSSHLVNFMLFSWYLYAFLDH